jgi:cephalosporin hydroxylase
MNFKNDEKEFAKEREANIKRLGSDRYLKGLAQRFASQAMRDRYPYNFDWLGRPIIQYPEDIVAIQELIWKVKPDLVIETGIARGGSLILSASILELIGGKGEVLGIDIDIRSHNRKRIEEHRMSKRISMIEGSSVDPKVFGKVKKFAKGKKRIIVFLDSSHNGGHVLKELELYSPLVSKGSYIVAFDTIAEFLPKGIIKNRPWGKGNSPWTAVKKFLRTHKNFVPDKKMENKLVITVAPDGFLRRVR